MIMAAQIDKEYFKICTCKIPNRLISYLFYEGRPITTKGRWINRFVFGWLKFQELISKKKIDLKPIFIVGTGRSGTTILGTTMSAHREIGFLNEPKAMWHHLYKYEDLNGNYTNKKARYRLSAEDASQSLIEKANIMYSNYLLFSFGKRVLDKYPELIFRYEFVRTLFPKSRFLFLYRNGYDTCHSIHQWSVRLGVESNGETHDWWGKDDCKWNYICDQIVANDTELSPYVNDIRQYKEHQYRAAVEWIVTMKEGIVLMEKHPDCVMGVKYEEYIGSSAIRQSVLDFCDLKHDKNFDRYCNKVLKLPKRKTNINLPFEIKNEFDKVMRKLGYE